MLFAISTYATSVKPGKSKNYCDTNRETQMLITFFFLLIALVNIAETTVENELAKNLKNIAAAHFIMTLAVTGIVGLQITHYVLNKRADAAELAAANAGPVGAKEETKKTK